MNLAKTSQGSLNGEIEVARGSLVVAEEGTWTLSAGSTLSVTDGALTIESGATLDTTRGTLKNAKASTAAKGIVLAENAVLSLDVESVFDRTKETPTLNADGIAGSLYNDGTVTIYNASSDTMPFITVENTISLSDLKTARGLLMTGSGSIGRSGPTTEMT